MNTTTQPGASEAEQRESHEEEIDGVRPGRFTGPGSSGFGFDGDEPSPHEAADEETLNAAQPRVEEESPQPRTDYSEDQARDDHGRFGSGSTGLEGHGKGSDSGVGRPGGNAGPSSHKGEGGTAKGGGLKDIMAKVEARNVAIKAFTAKGEKKIAGEGKDGKQVAVTPDLNKPGIWRVTSIDKDGEPMGHAEHANYHDAVKSAVVDHGMKLPSESNAAADKLTGEMGTHPFGFSWRPDTGHATTGIMVAEHPSSGSSHVIDLDKVKTADELRSAVREYVAKHYDTIMKDPALHFGGWKSEDEKAGTSKFYLDIARNHPKEDRDKAIAEGVRHNQIAVWDVDNSAEIKTGGTGE